MKLGLYLAISLLLCVFETRGQMQIMRTITFDIQPPGNGQITVTSDDGQPELTVTTTTTRKYADGTGLTFLATPKTGYGFLNWDGDATLSSASRTVVVRGSKTITANFRSLIAPRYTLTLQTNPLNSGGITADPAPDADGKYAEDTVVKLTATAAGANAFANWNGDPAQLHESTSVTLKSDTVMTANFIEYYVVKAQVSPMEGGRVVGSLITCLKGYSVKLSCEPFVGYEFSNWTINEVIVSQSASFTLTPSSNTVVVAHFQLVSKPYYVLTRTVSPEGGGTIGVTANQAADANNRYPAGTTVTLTAAPGPGYAFISWGGDASGMTPSTSVMLNRDMSVTATFVARPVVEFQPGLRRQIYTNMTGTSVADLRASAKFSLAPDIVDSVSSCESQYLPDNQGENYGQRLTGWLVPPVSGNYVFYLTADDQAEVFLSTDDNPAHKQPLVRQTSWSPWRDWESAAREPARVSAATPLIQGAHYYLEVLHKEDSGGDQVGLAWQLPGGAAPINGAEPIGMANLVYLPDMRELVLTALPENAGNISVSPAPPQGGVYSNGTVLTLTAQGTGGYQFSSWGGAVSGTVNPITFTFSGNQEVKANFTLPLTDVTQPGDPITPTSGNSPGNEGAAMAIDNSTQTKYFNFDKVNTGFTVTPRAGATVVTGLGLTSANDVPARDPASYQLEGANEGTAFSLIASGAVPAFTSRFQQQSVFFANTVAYTAYRLVFPTLAGEASADAMQIGEVQFFGAVAPRCALNFAAIPADGGVIASDPAPPSGQYVVGSSVTLRAQPAAGYRFVNWTEGETQLSLASDYTFAVTGNRTLVANFALIPPTQYQVAVSVAPVDTGDVSGGGVYNSGASVTVRASARSGFRFVNWTEGGTLLSVTSDYTFTLTGNRTLVANFEPYPIAAEQPGLRRQIYTNITGTTIADLRASAKFPLAPDIVDSVPTCESQYLPDNQGENYGQRLTGWLVPPLSGNYVFYLTADDQAEVLLSTDDNPANKKPLVRETAWSSGRDWESCLQNPARLSDPVALVQNTHYYLEVLHKEGMGEDQVWLAWQLPGSAAPVNGAEPIGAANLIYLVDMRELVLTVAPENAGNINVSPPPPQGGIYPAGTVLTLLAQGTAGYQFSGWGGVLNGTANPITFTFSGNQEVKANFALPLTDVTQPGEPVTPTSANSPSTEGAAKAIDNSTQTKYFNFDKLNAGFTVTPRLGSTVVTGLGLTSANDVPARDPASYRLEGSTGGTSFALIASGTLPSFTSRLQQQNLFFANTTAYKTYRLRFPTVAGGASADAMQIAEVQFFGVAAPTPPKIVATGVGGVLILSWDSSAAGWILESTASLLPPVGWTPVSGAADNRLAVPVNDATRFYRLRR